MKSAWRFIRFASCDAATNMAIDEAILEARILKLVPPTLRLYGFTPGAVTIGLNQKMIPQAVSAIRRAGFDLCRRPTGGRAVLHVDDLTYSFVGTDVTVADGFLSAGVNESYKEICAGLINAFANLRIQAEVGMTGAPYRHLQDCFMATTGCDLHHQGTKLIGSAQTRRRGVILQHGSVPLRQDPTLMSHLLGEPESASRHANLFDLACRTVEIGEMEEAFRKGFEDLFGVELVDGELTAAENQQVEGLRSTYALAALV